MSKEEEYKRILERIKYLIENTVGINPLLFKIHRLIEGVLEWTTLLLLVR